MNPAAALAVIAGLVALATLAGIFWRARNGRMREAGGTSVAARSLGPDVEFGSRATVLQFSTEYCGPCRVAERLLRDVTSERDGVRYIEVDLGQRPQLATEFGVMQTPTILLLDATGGIRARIGGVPRADEVAARLDEFEEESHAVTG
ncbi:thioredoxin family protein [Humibacter antri]